MRTDSMSCSRPLAQRIGAGSGVVALAIAWLACSEQKVAVIGEPPSLDASAPSDDAAAVDAAAVDAIAVDTGAIDAASIDAALDAGIIDTGAVDGTASDSGIDGTTVLSLEELQRAYIDLRFGMLLHFGILTYTGVWGEPNLPINQFNPTKMDPAQWADAAAAAKMRFAILSARHSEGFALWDSAVTTYDVGSIDWRNGKGDVVREFVDAFRARGIMPGFLYSVWDSTQGVGEIITRTHIDFVKAQLTELLTNYGPIGLLVFTGWSWKMGHNAMPYQEIRQLVKSLQPNCLIMDQTQLLGLWDVDVGFYDETRGTATPADNTFPVTHVTKIYSIGGNDWFWAPDVGGLLSTADITVDRVQKLESRWANLLLNCPVNREGLLDPAVVSRLTDVGLSWGRDLSRPPLPRQGPQNEYPYTPATATASSGIAWSAIDGINNYGDYSVWETLGALPQWITIDLGLIRRDVGFLGYVPRYTGNQLPVIDGTITAYGISTSTDGKTFTLATAGTWPASTTMKVATFGPVAARYIRLEARAATGTSAAATEITVGARR